MSHTIVTNTCEGVADCVDACPVACIHEGPGKNSKGTDWYWIDFATCIDCGICLQVCPVEGAIVPEERPDLQATPSVMLPSTHRQQMSEFQQLLKRCQAVTELTTLKSTFFQMQQFYQTQLLVLTADGLDPETAHRFQSVQTEISKQFRLLGVDITFLQAARQPETVQQRWEQVRDRLETLIQYCQAIEVLGHPQTEQS